MSIIISEKGMNARKLEPTSIAQEDYLQAYIRNNPNAIGAKQRWGEATFFAKVEGLLSPPAVEGMRKLYEFSADCGEVKWNTNQTGTYSVRFPAVDPRRAFYTVFSTGVLELNLSWHRDENSIAVADDLGSRLRRIPD